MAEKKTNTKTTMKRRSAADIEARNRASSDALWDIIERNNKKPATKSAGKK